MSEKVDPNIQPTDFKAFATKELAEKLLTPTEEDLKRKERYDAGNKARSEYSKKNNTADRLKKYQFKPGNNGNPHAGVKRLWSFYQSRVQDLTPQIIDRLVAILREGQNKDSLKAAELLLERAWGKATEQVHINHTGAAIPIINITIGSSPTAGVPPETRTIDITPKKKKATPPIALPQEPVSLEITKNEPEPAQQEQRLSVAVDSRNSEPTTTIITGT